MISAELQALFRSIDKTRMNTAHLTVFARFDNQEFPICSAMIYTLLDVTLAEFRSNILKLVEPERVFQPKLFRGGSVMGPSVEGIGVELRVRWGREAGKEELVQTDEELRGALLKMKNRRWTDLFLVICDLSRYVEGRAVEEKGRRGKKHNNTSN